MVKRLIVLFISLIIFSSCDNKHASLLNAIDILKEDFSNEELQQFKIQNEKDVLSGFHFSGQINDSILREYFYSKNITNIQCISNVLYLSLHRELNNKPIKINQQIENHKKLSHQQ